MSIALSLFEQAKKQFNTRQDVKEARAVIAKITAIVDELGKNFVVMEGQELQECQVKLSGYKFYLADIIADLKNKARYIDVWIKDEKARLWPQMKEQIKEAGNKPTRDEIENALLIQLGPQIEEQTFFDAEHTATQLKSYAIDDMLTAIVQRVAEKKREFEQVKNLT